MPQKRLLRHFDIRGLHFESVAVWSPIAGNAVAVVATAIKTRAVSVADTETSSKRTTVVAIATVASVDVDGKSASSMSVSVTSSSSAPARICITRGCDEETSANQQQQQKLLHLQQVVPQDLHYSSQGCPEDVALAFFETGLYNFS